MKCPLFRAANIVNDTDFTWSGDDCLKEDCAWWLKENQSCALLTIAQGHTYIHRALVNLQVPVAK